MLTCLRLLFLAAYGAFITAVAVGTGFLAVSANAVRPDVSTRLIALCTRSV